MARNVEIKARVADPAALEQRVRRLADDGPVEIGQDDAFFHCSNGRLKLRDFGDGRGELIYYRRDSGSGPRQSFYLRSPTSDPAALRESLALACGLRGRVVKQRRLYLVGRTRVHLDRVEGLGDFVELEVVLAEGEALADGEREAQALMSELGIAASDGLAEAYIDLLGAPP